MENNEKDTCPTCGGSGYVYQTDAQLGGDFFQQKPKGCYSQKVTCPRCGGRGSIAKLAVIIIAAILAYLLIF